MFQITVCTPLGTGTSGLRMDPRRLSWVREVLVWELETLVLRRSDKAPTAARTRSEVVKAGLEIYLCLRKTFAEMRNAREVFIQIVQAR